MKKPHGALSKEELLALVKPGQVIYKVHKILRGEKGFIRCAICTGSYTSSNLIKTVVAEHSFYLKNWFEKEFGYLFDNYFHALAYSLKLKANHGKAQSKERTGVEGAA